MSEATLICQMILDNSIIPSVTVTEQHFSDFRCKQAFNEIQRQYTVNGGATKDCLVDLGMDYEWIRETVNLVPASANYRFFEQKIKASFKSSFQKRIIGMASDMINGLQDGDPIEFLEKEITGFASEMQEYKTKQLKDVLYAGLSDIEARVNLGGELPGITSGLSKVDAHISGFQKRQYYIIGARPSDGKTAIGINFMLEAAKSGKTAGFISAESASEEIGRRIFSREGRIDATRISLGTLHPSDFAGLQVVGQDLSKHSILFYDEPNPMIETVERKAREWKRRDGLDILFIDYVQIIQGGKGDNLHERIADVSLRIKALGRGLGIPVVCMAQLTRTKENRKPMSSDIAGSDQITRDADGILLIHHNRDEETNRVKNSMIIIDKARDGLKGIVPVRFEGEYLNFRDV